MAKSKSILSLSALPPSFQPANATFAQFKELQRSDPLMAYFAGLYTFQIIFDMISSSTPDPSNVATRLITELEKQRSKLESNTRTAAIIQSPCNSREYIISYTQGPYDDAVTEVETHQASGRTVTTLMQCCVLFEAAHELFPYAEVYDDKDRLEEEQNEKEKGDEAEIADDTSEKKRETIINDGSDDLVDSLAQLKDDTVKDTELDEHITERLRNMANGGAGKTIDNKEDKVIEDMITQRLSQVNDEDLSERIRYCRDNARRIVTSVKEGRNPQLSATDPEIESRPITDNEISKAIRDALEEPEKTTPSFSFPQLPSTKPGEEQHETPKKAPEDGTDYEEEDNDISTFTVHHHETPSLPEPVPKQLSKEDVTHFLKDGELLETAQKCARFAISAINYEDVDTALVELHKAIDLLEKYRLDH